MSEPLRLAIDDGLARLTLNRPQRLNAFDPELAYAWADVTAQVVNRDDVGAIVLEGEGPSFCAGGDVLAMAGHEGGGAAIADLAATINRGIRNLTSSAVPVVAAAHGTTAGGGLGIMLASDYAVVGSDSKVGSLYARMGLTPDLSVTAHLARAVGERRALQLVLQDRLLSAEEAQEWGLVAEIATAPDATDPAAIAAAVRDRAEQIARFWLSTAPSAWGAAKQLVRADRDRSFTEQLAAEAHTIGVAFDTPIAQQRISEFAQASAQRRR